MQPWGVIPFARGVVLPAELHGKVTFIAIVDDGLHIIGGVSMEIDGLPWLGRRRRRLRSRIILA